MAERVSPTDRIRAEIHDLFSGDVDLASVLEQVARLSVQLTFQSVLEEIVCEELARGRYERRSAEGPEGHRNGFQPARVIKTTLGPVELQRPKLRGAHSAACVQLFGSGVTRTNAVETLVISCWVRGLSDRDIQACSPRPSARTPGSRARQRAASAGGSAPSSTPGAAAICPAW